MTTSQARPILSRKHLSTPSIILSSSLGSLEERTRPNITRYLHNMQNSDAIPRGPPEEHLVHSYRDGTPATILIMGLKRAGKSSVKNVVFHRLPSNETLYLEETRQPIEDTIHSILDFKVVDFHAIPSASTLPDIEPYFPGLSTIIWVIDAQDEYLNAVDRLVSLILEVQPIRRGVNFEIFVHKVDSISDDFKADVFRDIQQRVVEDIQEGGVTDALLTFYQTSVYDHSVFEAFSQVVQKLIPQTPSLQNLLNSLCANCGMIKAYLFDKDTKLYLASDTTPGNISMYEVCSDYIDMVIDMNNIYGWNRPYDPDEPSEEHGQGTESLITMERRGNQALYMREMDERAMLICILGESSPGEKKALIDYNVNVLHRALVQVLRRNMARNGTA